MTPDHVLLRDYPVVLGTANAEHIAEWVREFRLMAFAVADDARELDVPGRLAAMVAHLTSTYSTELSEPERVRDTAAARGQATVDLRYRVRPETEQTVLAWQAMLQEVDAYCRSQGLLTLARSAELVALSDWVLEEFLRQLRGEAPRPWRRRLHAVD